MEIELAIPFPAILIGVVVLALAVWALLRARRKARVITDGDSLKRDVLDEGAAPAPRNQALIDAAPAAVKPEPLPVPEPAPVPVPIVATASRDDLTRIKGLGPKLAALLGEMGITSYAQIASWSEEDVARIDARLGRFAGRITRDQWITQAQFLAAGDEAGFAAKFGQNG